MIIQESDMSKRLNLFLKNRVATCPEKRVRTFDFTDNELDDIYLCYEKIMENESGLKEYTEIEWLKAISFILYHNGSFD